MTTRQKILEFVYPLFVFYKKVKAKPRMLFNIEHSEPRVSFYSLDVQLNIGSRLLFRNLAGKKVLLVNTASNCGYTAQYKELQHLQEKFQDRLQVIGFPSNDFKQQEKEGDQAIAEFCSINFGVTFPLCKKSHVLKGKEQNIVFKWLTTKSLNGWNEQQPTWNFSKYLVDEHGILINYFDPAISPLSKDIIKHFEENSISS